MIADVCLLLEGTYPYVRGGVSAWVHQLIRGLHDLRFSLVFVGSRRSDYGEPKYALPENVTHVETHFLEDAYKGYAPARVELAERKLEPARCMHAYFQHRAAKRELTGSAQERLEGAVDTMLTTLEQKDGVSAAEFLFGSGAWNFIREKHLEDDTSAPFIDYFWTVRIIHGPIFQLARAAANIPEARVYHAVSTGYAGLLGALLERRRKRPFILSEHGIYTKERRIDLNQAEWLDELHPAASHEGDSGARLRQLWIRCFESFGRLAYRSANPILSLYAGNRERQHQDGASPDRTRIIVNGIDISRFERARRERSPQIPHVIGLIGRIVPIKDVKTFVRALGLVVRALPDAEGWVIGGADEDSAYDTECRLLVDSLGLSEKVRFLGHRDVAEILPRLGLLMLTSISEAQPLAILEAMAAGVPCIATDVGACREQIEGATPEDRALGRAGRVVPFADHEALSRAAIELLGSEREHASCQRAAVQRVERYYGEASMLDSYRSVYRDAMETPWQA